MARWKHEAAEVFLVFALAMAIRIVSIDQGVGSLQYDEYYHLLAAQGWLHGGSFRVGDGYYPRAGAFTWLVAQAMALAPGNILAARMPAIIAGSLLIASVFVWTRRFGNGAAWTAALLLCFENVTVDASQIVRFYSLHTFAFWIGSVSVYEAVYSRGLRQIALVLVAVAALALALHLQSTTLIGIAALGAWGGAAWIAAAPMRSRPRRAIVVALLATAVLLVTWLLRDLPIIAGVLARYRWSPTFEAARRNDWLFYVRNFAAYFGILFYLLPVAALVAARRNARPVLFCLTMIAVTLALHSGAGSKDMHYVAYMLPFFFVPWGLAAAPLAAAIYRQARLAVVRLQLPRFAATALTWATIGIALASSSTFFSTARAAKNVLLGTAQENMNSSAWAAATPELRRLAAGVSVFVVGNDVHALYFIGGYDLMLSRTMRDDYAPGREFVVDPRTGGATIATAPSMRLVIDCYPSGLIALPGYAWRNPIGVANDVADTIEMLATRVPLRSTKSMVVYRWRNDTQPEAGGCETVYRVAGLPGRVPFTIRR